MLALPGGDDEKIQSLYLRTLSRLPDASEIASARELLATPAIEEEEPTADPEVEAKANVKGKGNAKGKAAKGNGRGKGAAVASARAVPGKTRAYEDLFWALLNSSEFALNH